MTSLASCFVSNTPQRRPRILGPGAANSRVYSGDLSGGILFDWSTDCWTVSDVHKGRYPSRLSCPIRVCRAIPGGSLSSTGRSSIMRRLDRRCDVVVLTPSFSSSAGPFGRNGRGPSMESQHRLRARVQIQEEAEAWCLAGYQQLGLRWLWLKFIQSGRKICIT
jgi:hypothetical protein